jgi:hypothetical protein
MKYIILFAISFGFLKGYGQDTVNQHTADGLKIGEWVYYDSFGRVKLKEFYTIKTREFTSGEAFLPI